MRLVAILARWHACELSSMVLPRHAQDTSREAFNNTLARYGIQQTGIWRRFGCRASQVREERGRCVETQTSRVMNQRERAPMAMRSRC